MYSFRLPVGYALAAGVLAFAFGPTANAVIVDFEDLVTTPNAPYAIYGVIPSPYHGINFGANWEFGNINFSRDTFPAHSGEVRAFAYFPGVAGFSFVSPSVFKGFWISGPDRVKYPAAAGFPPPQVRVTLSLNGVKVAETSIINLAAYPIFIASPYAGAVDRVGISELSGACPVDQVLSQLCGYAIDDIDYSPPPPPCSYTLAPTAVTALSIGGPGMVSIIADPKNDKSCTWTAVSNNPWITLTGATSGSGNGSVSYLVASIPDPKTPTRVGTLSIASRTFTVTQNGGITFSAFNQNGKSTGIKLGDTLGYHGDGWDPGPVNILFDGKQIDTVTGPSFLQGSTKITKLDNASGCLSTVQAVQGGTQRSQTIQGNVIAKVLVVHKSGDPTVLPTRDLNVGDSVCDGQFKATFHDPNFGDAVDNIDPAEVTPNSLLLLDLQPSQLVGFPPGYRDVLDREGNTRVAGIMMSQTQKVSVALSGHELILLPPVGMPFPNIDEYDPSAFESTRAVGPTLTSTDLDGYFATGGNLFITGDINLHGVLFVKGNLSVLGSIRGTGGILSTGKILIRGAVDLHANDIGGRNLLLPPPNTIADPLVLLARGEITLCGGGFTTGLCGPPIAADVNADGTVDCDDMQVMADNIDQAAKGHPTFIRTDVNGDGKVDVRDLAIVARSLPAGTKCP